MFLYMARSLITHNIFEDNYCASHNQWPEQHADDLPNARAYSSPISARHIMYVIIVTIACDWIILLSRLKNIDICLIFPPENLFIHPLITPYIIRVNVTVCKLLILGDDWFKCATRTVLVHSDT